MIRNLYQELDSQLSDFHLQFQNAQESLRTKFDLEIKTQMANLPDKIHKTYTPSYQKDFLDIIGKNTFHNKIQTTANFKPILHSGTSPTSVNQPFYYSSFFYNLELLNQDSLLRDDEYIVGVYGFITCHRTTHVRSQTPEELVCRFQLNVITNYLNLYRVNAPNGGNLTQHNYHKTFQERYQLKEVRKNNLLLSDREIDIITSIYHKIKIVFQGFHQDSLNLKYGFTIFEKSGDENNPNPCNNFYYEDNRVEENTLKVLEEQFQNFWVGKLTNFLDVNAEKLELETKILHLEESNKLQEEIMKQHTLEIAPLQEKLAKSQQDCLEGKNSYQELSQLHEQQQENLQVIKKENMEKNKLLDTQLTNLAVLSANLEKTQRNNRYLMDTLAGKNETIRNLKMKVTDLTFQKKEIYANSYDQNLMLKYIIYILVLLQVLFSIGYLL